MGIQLHGARKQNIPALLVAMGLFARTGTRFQRVE